MEQLEFLNFRSSWESNIVAVAGIKQIAVEIYIGIVKREVRGWLFFRHVFFWENLFYALYVDSQGTTPARAARQVYYE